MTNKPISIRPFIGAKDFDLSRKFYLDLGFTEKILSPSMSLFTLDKLGFYLQRAYVKDWIDNTMIFLEVNDVNSFRQELMAKELPSRYPGVRLSEIRNETWGSECFLHDPSGILWHIGQLNS